MCLPDLNNQKKYKKYWSLIISWHYIKKIDRSYMLELRNMLEWEPSGNVDIVAESFTVWKMNFVLLSVLLKCHPNNLNYVRYIFSSKGSFSDLILDILSKIGVIIRSESRNLQNFVYSH